MTNYFYFQDRNNKRHYFFSREEAEELQNKIQGRCIYQTDNLPKDRDIEIHGTPKSIIDLEDQTRERIKEKYNSSNILMQYRHAGSNSEIGMEWGLWIIENNNKYFGYHESEDRVRYGKRSKEVIFENRERAIDYANWHINKDWYSDERFVTKGITNDDFPRKSPPSKDQRVEAIKRFISWKERADDNNEDQTN